MNTLSPDAYSTRSGTPSIMTISSPLESAARAIISRPSTHQSDASGALNKLDLHFKNLRDDADNSAQANDVAPDYGSKDAHQAVLAVEPADAHMSDLTTSEDLIRDVGLGAASITDHPPAGVDIVEGSDLGDTDDPLLSHNFQFTLRNEMDATVPMEDLVLGSSTAVSGSGLAPSHVRLESESQIIDDGDDLDALQAEDASTLFSGELLEEHVKTDW